MKTGIMGSGKRVILNAAVAALDVNVHVNVPAEYADLVATNLSEETHKLDDKGGKTE